MDYTALAVEMLQKTGVMMKMNVPKQMNMLLHGEMFILHYLSHKGTEVLPSELSTAMEASTARVAMALKSMEGKGLIERRADSSDRRKVKVSITEYGSRLIKDQHEDMARKMEKILSELGEKDAREFIRIVERITEISRNIQKETACFNS